MKISVKELVDHNGKSNGYIKTLRAVVNPNDNGGESVSLSVDVYDNGDGLKEGMFTNTKLETNCYGVSSSQITLWGIEFDALAEAVNLIEKEIMKLKPVSNWGI